MPADIAFTHHAIERFIERHAQGSTAEEARAHLTEVDAVRLRERTILGQFQYQVESPRCVLVVKRDASCSPPLVCVTVLPERENSRGWSEDEEAIRNEWLADQAAAKTKEQIARPVESIVKPYNLQPPASAKPKPPPKTTLPRDTEQARLVAEVNLKTLELAALKEVEKTKRHEIANRYNDVVIRRCLRMVLLDVVARAAGGDAQAKVLAERIQEIRPAFLTDEFLRVETEGTEQ